MRASSGARFRFFHVAPLAGFKAGALNFALEHTAPDAEVIAVIDSDYMVEPDWLRDLVPAFDDPRIAIVQAPQDYRDDGDNAFKAMCYAEYRGFFHIGMITRNERNAIIQHGTMTHGAALRAAGRSAAGPSGASPRMPSSACACSRPATRRSTCPRSYGRGLMPDTFIDFKKQRFRWAYGAMQILQASRARAASAGGSALTAGPALSLPRRLAALDRRRLQPAVQPRRARLVGRHGARRRSKIDPPLLMFSVLPLSLFTFKLAKLVHLYTHRVGANVRQTAAAAIAGLALAHTIGLAVAQGPADPQRAVLPHAQAQRAAPLSVRRWPRRARRRLMMLALWLSARRHPHHPERHGEPRPDGLARGAADPVDSVCLRAARLARQRFQYSRIAARHAARSQSQSPRHKPENMAFGVQSGDLQRAYMLEPPACAAASASSSAG